MLLHYRGKRLTIVRRQQRGQTWRNSWMEAYNSQWIANAVNDKAHT